MRTSEISTRPVVQYAAGAAYVRVYGVPAPKGSKRIGLVAGRHVPVDDAKGYAAWKRVLEDAATEYRLRRFPILDGPLVVSAMFYLPRPARSRFGDWPAGPPDLSKLIRALEDPFNRILWADDARIVSLRAPTGKRWASAEEPPGAVLEVVRHSL